MLHTILTVSIDWCVLWFLCANWNIVAILVLINRFEKQLVINIGYMVYSENSPNLTYKTSEQHSYSYSICMSGSKQIMKQNLYFWFDVNYIILSYSTCPMLWVQVLNLYHQMHTLTIPFLLRGLITSKYILPNYIPENGR